ncbi:uncharacterized protein LOC114580562 [Dendrobium catenatum]|uniref:uncharacterized protein LOC114580562 n=1 Tax=Dendrobium catenatum TaxID=906689 RepID=UPI00109FC393|nr:uncharacterized protein LOC114580562 [Dendrobium catenatum]
MELVEQRICALDNAVVGKIIGKKLPYIVLSGEIKRQWGRFGDYHLSTIGTDCFVCRFSSEEARDAVLCGGPWFFNGNIVGLDRWTPAFSPNSLAGLSSPVWIRLPQLPLQYWDLHNLMRIASHFGTPLWIDVQTGGDGRREYERICVRQDLAQKLQPGTWINGWKGKFYQKVEYEGLGMSCFGCGRIGHRQDSCPARGDVRGAGQVGTSTGISKGKAILESGGSSVASTSRARPNPREQPKEVPSPSVSVEGGATLRTLRSRFGLTVMNCLPQLLEGICLLLWKETNQNYLKKKISLESGILGARKKNTGNFLRHLVVSNEVGLVGLIETKVESISRVEVDRLVGREWDFFHHPANGRSGGLLLAWRCDILKVEVDFAMDQCVVGWVVMPSLVQWKVALVYGNKDLHGEKKGGKRFRFSTGDQEMSNALSQLDLHDLGFTGPSYKCSNNKEGNSRIWVRLDRILVNSEGAKWIRFKDVWTSFPASWRIVAKAWGRLDAGPPAEVVNRKCSHTLRALHFWSKHTIRDLGVRRKELEEKIELLQRDDCSDTGLTSEQDSELQSAVSEFNSTLARLVTWWRQRAKIRWIEDGDANSHFFHATATPRHRSNRIEEIQTTAGFFSDKWREHDTSYVRWPGSLEADRITEQARGALEEDISDEEIRKAVFGISNNRAPGNDGITISFLKFYWFIIRNDICAAVKDFFITSSMCASWKDTLVVLIPKTTTAKAPAQFRSISLCQTFYKVVAKVLVARLKPVLARLIGEEQGAFVPVRSISNHGLLAQEIMCKFQHSTLLAGLLAAKVDMEQAYYCMAWDTLYRVLEAMGFSPKFIGWIVQCITKPRFSLLLNGTRIPAKRGEPWSANYPKGERVSHLLYADDILISAEATRANATKILEILGDYCMWTGQRINNAKSAVLFSKHCPRWKSRRLANVLGFRMVSSLEYLGLPLALRKLTASDFDRVLMSATNKVNVWGKRHLSLAGRATLIRTALLAIPLYCMTLSDVPRGVLASVDKIGRQFLWHKDNNRRGLHYVAWSKICRPHSHGGLGFHSSLAWRAPLWARLTWDFIRQPTVLLKRILRAKYGEDPWNMPTGRNTSITWKAVHEGAVALRPIIRWRIGNGQMVDIF